jgi:hypothetical protein
MWVRHLLLHRVEALAAVARPRALDPLRRALLRLLSATHEVSPEGLGIDRQVLGQMLRGLEREGLVRPDDGWALTDGGRHALENGASAGTAPERRTFYFLDRAALQMPPHWLPLAPSVAEPFVPGEGWHFDPAALEACVGQPAAWKARYGFPADVVGLLAPGPAGGPAAEWRRVVLDRPEQLPAVLVETAAGGGAATPGPRLLGFATRAPGWVLERTAPVLELGEGWEEVFPDLAAGLPPEAWRQAWQEWCHPRGLPPGEVEACALEPAGHLLRVRAPQRLVERLRAARSDAVKQEAWLLAGRGPGRVAAQIDLVGGEPGR